MKIKDEHEKWIETKFKEGHSRSELYGLYSDFCKDCKSDLSYNTYARYVREIVSREYNLTDAEIHDLKKIKKQIIENDLDIDDVKSIIRTEGKYNKLKDDYKELNRKYTKIIKHEYEYQNNLDDISIMIEENINKPEFLSNVNWEKEVQDTDSVFLVNFTDIHYGSNVISERVGNVNTFNKYIAEERIHEYFTKIYQMYILNTNSKFYLLFGGDLFHGNIHADAETDLTINEALVNLIEIFSREINSLCEYINHKNIECHFVVGNHSRVQELPSCTNKVKMNYEYVFANMIENMIKCPCFITETYYDIIDLKEVNKKVCLYHGDVVKGSNGKVGVPTNGIVKRNNQLKNINNYDFAIIGHFHNPAFFTDENNIQTVVCGSLMGVDEYSFNVLGMTTKSSQTVLKVTENGIEEIKNIYFSK